MDLTNVYTKKELDSIIWVPSELKDLVFPIGYNTNAPIIENPFYGEEFELS